MKISEQLKTMFNEAQALNAELNDAWVKISHRVGGRLPDSLLSNSIQRDGAVDLLLRAIEERSTQEAAELLDLTPTAVKVRLHRARQALSTLVRQEYHAQPAAV